MLSAVFGRRMGFLVLLVAFSGWMIVLSSIWFFGFYSQGLGTKTNLGPRGSEPTWVPVESGIDVSSPAIPRGRPISRPSRGRSRRPASTPRCSRVTSAVQTFLVEHANEEAGLSETERRRVHDDRTSASRTSGSRPRRIGRPRWRWREPSTPAAGRALTVLLRHDSGSVPRYSIMFLVGSIVLFLLTLPLLDRAEKKRKEILTGGEAPPWYGPA